MIRSIRPAVALLVIAAAACSRNATSPPAGAWHAHVVCSPADQESAARCDRGAISREFEHWLTEAVYEPESTFTVWIGGHDRQSVHARFVVCVPHTWGARVMDAKAAFLSEARQRIAALAPGTGPTIAFPEGCATAGESDDGRHTLQILAARGDHNPLSKTAQGITEQQHVAVVCDRSDSGLGMTCNTPELLQVYDRWLAAGSGTGATFAVYKVGSSRDTAQRIFSITVPNGSPGWRAAFLIAVRSELAGAMSGALEKNASAVAEAVHLAASDLRRHHGTHLLVVLSDLRQVTPGIWNFERKVPAPAEFLRWLGEGGLNADLARVPVIVCGLHHQRGPGARPFDATLANQIFETWRAVFQTMGSTQVEMLADCKTELV